MKAKKIASSSLILLFLLLAAFGSFSYVDAGQIGTDGHRAAQIADSDGDGVADDVDQCPSEYGSPDYGGCPYDGDFDDDCDGPSPSSLCFIDTDGDGHNDYYDECPRQPGPLETYGCPVQQTGPTLTPTHTLVPVDGDADLDGVPDSQDRCPYVSGRGDQFGGVTGTDGCPVDSDGDGVVDGLDQCPFAAGTAENNGCPAPSSNLPTLPTSGACVLATQGTQNVNMRLEPSTDSDIAGQILPQNVYNVIGFTERADGRWYQLENGRWVAGFATRQGGNCNSLTDTGGGQQPQQPQQPEQPPVAGVVVNVAPSTVDLTGALSVCPQLVRDAQTLPIHVQLDLVNGGHPYPCDYLNELLADLIFGAPDPQLSEANVNAILDQCPDVLPALISMMDTLYTLNAGAWSLLDSVMNPQNACSLAEAIARNELPPEFAAALGAATRHTPTPNGGIVLTSARHAPLTAPVSAAQIDAAIAICSPPLSLTPVRAGKVRAKMLADGIDSTELFTPAANCALLIQYTVLGDITPAQQALMDRLMGDCALSPSDAWLYYQSLILFLDLNINAVLALDTASLCPPASPALLATVYVLPHPDIPPTLSTCIGLAAFLQGYGSELTLYQLWVLLQDPANACGLTINYLLNGSMGPGPLPAPPACFDLGGNQVLLGGGQTITGASPWQQKIAVLSRSAADVCNPLALPPGDSDTDGLTDDVDACPNQFALTPNGCPTNTPPNIAPIPAQTLATGAFINVGVVANDPDAGDVVTLTVSSDNPAFANATIAGTVITITGVAPGTANITVTASDGTANTPLTFVATVNTPPAPNTPPSLNPIPGQSVARGKSLNVNFVATDPDNDPLTFSVAASDPSIIGLSLAGTTISIQGKKVGTAVVTLIANDGKTSTSTVIGVTVTAPAPTTSGRSAAQQSLIDNGIITEEQLTFGLIDFPSGQDVTGSGVFQASDPNGKTNIYLLKTQDFVALLDGATENHLFPALNPTGELIAFLTQDANNAVVLRILSLERGISLTLFNGDATRQVGLYPVSWSPNGKSLLFTLVMNNTPGVYALDVGDPTNIPEPVLVVQNATTASYAPNGRYFAFVQNNAVHVGMTDKPGTTHPISDAPNSQCFAPMFGGDSIALFFVCETNGQRSLYRYDLNGITLLNVGIPNASNPAPGPGNGFIGFDDGQQIYFGKDDGSKVAVMLRLENQSTSNMRWTTTSETVE